VNTSTLTPPQQARHVIVTPVKSIGVSILLTILLGPLGLFYASVMGALILILGIPVLGAALAAVALPGAHDASAALGFLTLVLAYAALVWPTAVIWGALAVRSYNRKLVAP
jgi:hypothetical protein